MATKTNDRIKLAIATFAGMAGLGAVALMEMAKDLSQGRTRTATSSADASTGPNGRDASEASSLTL
jgi:hypothetical protein